ncbi:VOC family protein [Cohnella lubricantis]|nr:VOC family protein [Cohnella lubricantis]
MAGVTLLASDLTILKRFYRDRLELPVLSEEEHAFTITAGATKLTFSQAEAGAQPYYHFAFNVSTSRMDSAVRWLGAQGIEVFTEEGSAVVHSERWNSDQVYFHDPAGNIVELIVRHTLPGETEEDYHPRHVLNVSEVGLPADDVPELAGLLTGRLEEGVYLSGTDTFTPIGDEEGLLILVRTGRIWFGSDRQAAVYPVRIELEREGMAELQLLSYPYYLRTGTVNS